MINESAFIATKSVSAGGLSMLLVAYFDDVEFVMLLSTGLFASIVSFIYDFVHKEVENKRFGLVEATDLMKSIFYGIPMMFAIYYLGVNNTSQYIDMPISVWGFIAMLSAGSAVSIVEWFAPVLKAAVSKFIDKRS